MILDGQFEDALAVARQQVENGAQIIDVNMDEAMLDSKAAMVRFLNLIASEPEIARVPIMIDCSKWSVIEAGLKCIQGKGIVNSISMKEGEAEFRRQATLVRRYGAATVVMAFDETGPGRHASSARPRSARAPTASWSTRSASRPRTSSSTPTSSRSPPASRSTTTTRSTSSRPRAGSSSNLPGAKVSGGVSNVSFSFRGNEPVREAIHTVFLYHAIKAGMDMGIVNAGMVGVYDDLDAELRERVEDVVLNRRTDAGERLVEIAESAEGRGQGRQRAAGLARRRRRRSAWRTRWCTASPTSSSTTPRKCWQADPGQGRAAAARDRRPADGRHEHRRRPVRRRARCSCRRW